MKKAFSQCVFIALVSLLIVFSNIIYAADQNFIDYGSFDGEEAMVLNEFKLQGMTFGKFIQFDLENKVQGSHSLRIENKYGSNITIVKNFPVDTSEGRIRLHIKAYIKTENVREPAQQWNGAIITTSFFNEAGAAYPNDASVVTITNGAMKGTHDWQLIDRIIIVNTGVASVSLTIGITGAKGVMWVDGLSIEQVDSDKWQVSEDETAEIRLDWSNPVSTMSQGIGWNWQYAHNIQFDELVPDMFQQFYKHASWDGQDWVRIAFWPNIMRPLNYERGKDDGRVYNYDFSTRYLNRIWEVLSFFKSRNINVEMGCWSAGSYEFNDLENSRWLGKPYYEGEDKVVPEWVLPYSKQRFAECLASFMNHAINVRGFDNIKFISIQNEPANAWTAVGKYPEEFFSIYELLDNELRKYGVRNKVKILGADSEERVGPIVDHIEKFGQFVDAVAVHDYWFGLDFATESFSQEYMTERIEEYKNAVQKLKAMHGRELPLYVTEVCSYRTNRLYGERQQYIATLANAEYIIRNLEGGVQGFLGWAYNTHMANGLTNPSQWNPLKVSFDELVPNRPVYYGWAVLTRWTVKDSRVYAAKITGGMDERGLQRVFAVGIESPEGERTILLVNDGQEPKEITIDLSGNKDWHHYYYDFESVREAVDELSIGGTYQPKVVTVKLNPESINCITTFDNGLEGEAPR